MTRVAVLADIHGNLPALDAVLADVAPWRPDAIVHAGDAVCWGAQSREVLERLREVGAPGIRGNNELYLLDSGTSRMPDAGCRMPDAGCRMPDAGCRMPGGPTA